MQSVYEVFPFQIRYPSLIDRELDAEEEIRTELDRAHESNA